MTQEDKKEFQFLRKLAEAKVWQMTQFDSSPQMEELCKETIDIYNKIIKLLKKYTK